MVYLYRLNLDYPRIEVYLVTFTDDHSRYGYVYLLHEKSEALTAVFKAEVENLLDKRDPSGQV
jgi:hypothetical protein